MGIGKEWEHIVRVIVFGANGFLGAYVYRKLTQPNHPAVHVIGTCGAGSEVRELIPQDLTSDAPVRHLLRDVQPDVVIWCVKAREGQDEIRLTQGGLSAVVDAVGHSSRIIFVSTDAVLPGTAGHYGEATVPVESVGMTGLDHYINAKIEAERLIGENSSDFCIVRPGPIFGTGVDGRWDARTHRLLEALGRGERIEQPLNLIRTYAHVQDLAESLSELARLPVNGVLHVGAPTPASHFDFAMAVAHRASFSTRLVRDFEISPEEATGRQVRLDTSMDTSRAAQCLRTRFRSVPEALAEEPDETIR